MSEDRASPLANLPGPRWRAHARDFARRPLFVRQLLVVSAAAALLLPFLYFSHLRHDESPSTMVDLDLGEARHVVPAFGVHLNDGPPPIAQPHQGDNSPAQVNRPHLDDAIVPTPHVSDPPQTEALAVAKPPEPIVFALIMWSENAASEGAILVKSIMMYTSVAVQLHIICDEEAHRYLDHRLALVQRPRHNVTVRFYRPTWEQMAARIEREGRISSVHAAGIPGLMKLFLHELLPPSVPRVIFVDTDAFFISDPLLLWRQFAAFAEPTALALPSHPEMFAPQWFDANKICSCVMLLDLAALRRAQLMASALYPPPYTALGPQAFAALFGAPDARTGRYEDVALGDQSFWWAIIQHAPALFRHLPYDWEVSSCLLDMYATGLGRDDAAPADELRAQLHTWATPHQGEVVLPKLVHFNCLEGPRYHEWPGWDDADNSLAQRWAPTVRHHAGYKWLWLNQGADGTRVTVETVSDARFADELVGGA